MITSEREYNRAMRRVIRCVRDGGDPLAGSPSRDDVEVVAECVVRGYLLPRGDGQLMRTADGHPHPLIDLEVVPVKGLAFLRPDYIRLKANLAIVLSVLALLVSGLAYAQQIAETIRYLTKLAQ